MSEPSKAGSGGKAPLLGCLIIVVVAAGGCAAMAAYGSNSDSSRKVDAKVWCEQYVKDQLKAPSSADFSGEATTKGADKDTYTVAGAVDSQNSFGAKLRNTFSCTVRKRPDGDTWDLVSLTGITN